MERTIPFLHSARERARVTRDLVHRQRRKPPKNTHVARNYYFVFGTTLHFEAACPTNAHALSATLNYAMHARSRPGPRLVWIHLLGASD